MKIEIEHIIGVIIGLAPLVIIAIIFKNDDVMCLYYVKHYVALMGIISTLAVLI